MPTPANYTPHTPNPTVRLFDHIRFTHDAAVDAARDLARAWDALEGRVDADRFKGVQARFAQQVNDAAAMRDTILGQYGDWAGM